MYKLYKQSIYCSNDFLDCNLFFLSKLIDSCFMRVRTLIQFEILQCFTEFEVEKTQWSPSSQVPLQIPCPSELPLSCLSFWNLQINKNMVHQTANSWGEDCYFGHFNRALVPPLAPLLKHSLLCCHSACTDGQSHIEWMVMVVSASSWHNSHV